LPLRTCARAKLKLGAVPRLLTARSYSPLVIAIVPRPHLESAVAAVIELKYSSAFTRSPAARAAKPKLFLITSLF
jgi:hypothetical protein